jgi:hypothetical protein
MFFVLFRHWDWSKWTLTMHIINLVHSLFLLQYFRARKDYMPLQKVAPICYASSLFDLHNPYAYDLGNVLYYLCGPEHINFWDEQNASLHLLLHFTNRDVTIHWIGSEVVLLTQSYQLINHVKTSPWKQLCQL